MTDRGTNTLALRGLEEPFSFFQFAVVSCQFLVLAGNRFWLIYGQTTVPFFLVEFFSRCNLNPPKSIAGQMTVPFFPVVIFPVVSTILGVRVKIRTPIMTRKNDDQKKKVQSSGRLCFSNHRKKLRPEKKVHSSDRRLK
jgi:hypothetical protein